MIEEGVYRGMLELIHTEQINLFLKIYSFLTQMHSISRPLFKMMT